MGCVTFSLEKVVFWKQNGIDVFLYLFLAVFSLYFALSLRQIKSNSNAR
jgi:hypothetical protein